MVREVWGCWLYKPVTTAYYSTWALLAASSPLVASNTLVRNWFGGYNKKCSCRKQYKKIDTVIVWTGQSATLACIIPATDKLACTWRPHRFQNAQQNMLRVVHYTGHTVSHIHRSLQSMLYYRKPQGFTRKWTISNHQKYQKIRTSSSRSVSSTKGILNFIYLRKPNAGSVD